MTNRKLNIYAYLIGIGFVIFAIWSIYSAFFAENPFWYNTAMAVLSIIIISVLLFTFIIKMLEDRFPKSKFVKSVSKIWDKITESIFDGLGGF